MKGEDQSNHLSYTSYTKRIVVNNSKRIGNTAVFFKRFKLCNIGSFCTGTVRVGMINCYIYRVSTILNNVSVPFKLILNAYKKSQQESREKGFEDAIM